MTVIDEVGVLGPRRRVHGRTDRSQVEAAHTVARVHVVVPAHYVEGKIASTI